MENNEKERGILIVGNVGQGTLTAVQLVKIKAAHPNIEIVTLEEAKNRGLQDTFIIENTMKKFDPHMLNSGSYTDCFNTGFSSRAARRKAERDAKKKKK